MKNALLLAGLLSSLAFAGCVADPDELFFVFVAGSLGPVFTRAFEPEFERRHADVDVVVEAQGSRETAKKVTDLGREADFVAVADVGVIESLMMPAFASYAVRFASNAMVLAYTDDSEGVEKIREITGDPTGRPWYDVLAENDRVLAGRSDPDTDPAGYRTLFLWRLADAHYGEPVYDRLLDRFPTPGVDTEAILSAQLEVGDLDYVFTYRSLAIDHGHDYVDLPDAIDLSNASHEETYATANETLGDGKTVTGTTILYGFTIPTNAPHPDLALEFAALVASEWGMGAFRDADLLAPPPGHDKPFVPEAQVHALPEDLHKRVEVE